MEVEEVVVHHIYKVGQLPTFHHHLVVEVEEEDLDMLIFIAYQ